MGDHWLRVIYMPSGQPGMACQARTGGLWWTASARDHMSHQIRISGPKWAGALLGAQASHWPFPKCTCQVSLPQLHHSGPLCPIAFMVHLNAPFLRDARHKSSLQSGNPSSLIKLLMHGQIAISFVHCTIDSSSTGGLEGHHHHLHRPSQPHKIFLCACGYIDWMNRSFT